MDPSLSWFSPFEIDGHTTLALLAYLFVEAVRVFADPEESYTG